MPQPSDPTPEPSERSVHDYLLYSLSLPERALRSTAGMAGGVVREGANLLVPQAFRSSKSYEIVVQQGLDFLTSDVGGVRHEGDAQPAPKIEGYVAKKTVGSFVEMASLATLHLSPALLLAVVSDVAYGSQTYLKELAIELKREGVIDENSTIDHAGDLLEAIRNSSAVGAEVFDTPPLSVEGITQAINDTSASVRKIDPTKVLPAAEIDRLWRDMHEVARGEDVTLLEVSGAMTLHALNRADKVAQGALSGVTIAGTLLDRLVVDHYRSALTDIHTRGYYNTLADVSQPYITAVWENFSTDRSTITEDLLSGKLVGQAATVVGRWFGLGQQEVEAAENTDPQGPDSESANPGA
ncbi:hypothetical protein NG895_03615 [Aeoliella sp. ICT_H6.2]|uniref:Uncharacterized protein n=1 Tax=Aeoliella straminimaris TaxID=2954799 RepID=A0A9X2JEG2_9BACT|nr:hypothetical protein [Aeoliella straminimaris]MCO6042985.1 hypothetical protein [Aeoliella straminimaris]